MDSAGGEKPANFHDRLYEALQTLVEFIHAEGLGLTHEVIKNDDYWRVEQRLQYHKTSTEHLIDLFYMQRFQEQVRLQNSQEPAQYGILSVRAYLNHDSLCVEVLRAQNVIPLDPNGFSDPFVIIELLPRRVFMHCTEQQTHVHKVCIHNVNIYGECGKSCLYFRGKWIIVAVGNVWARDENIEDIFEVFLINNLLLLN